MMKKTFNEKLLLRKNTPEIIEELKFLGYEHGFSRIRVGRGISAKVEEIPGEWILTDKDGKYYHVNHNIEGMLSGEEYDCGNDEELFLSLAALSEDTDFYQWFVDDNNPDYWEKIESDLPSRYMMMNGHKATREEIINRWTQRLEDGDIKK